MIYHCNNTNCPQCSVLIRNKPDLVAKATLPEIIHVCACEGRQKHDGICLRCSGLRG